MEHSSMWRTCASKRAFRIGVLCAILTPVAKVMAKRLKHTQNDPNEEHVTINSRLCADLPTHGSQGVRSRVFQCARQRGSAGDDGGGQLSGRERTVGDATASAWRIRSRTRAWSTYGGFSGAENDYTAEEEAEFRKRYEWAFEDVDPDDDI
ncbi:hypothetical protein F3Y22_tig00002840pilonHSYRG01394 [Hibiscus syriacus]|uniref:Uncharacterized protein n=1 Tax=Hibiscus syriacus TaxID=106335 RepID=A0A6A3CVM8_HIBSY|nr:hypothetical protein F3Y22_tig00002840pilonHSYRG01394 [Hibiscus syriacus]